MVDLSKTDDRFVKKFIKELQKMFHLSIREARNIPIATKKLRKTKICLFSGSGPFHFLGQQKSKTNSINPTFSLDVEIPFYIADNICILFFADHIFQTPILFGKAHFEPGRLLQNQILEKSSTIPTQFTINFDDGYNQNTQLSFFLSYHPFPFQNKMIKKASFLTPLYSYINYNPPISYSVSQPPVEIQIMHCLKNCNFEHEVFYSVFDGTSDWSFFGENSRTRFIPGPTGPTHVVSFSCYSFIYSHPEQFLLYIIKSNSYKGLITFVYNVCCINSKKNELNFQCYDFKSFSPNQSGIFQTVDICVEPEKYYVVPLVFDFKHVLFSIKDEFHSFNFPPLQSENRNDLINEIIESMANVEEYSSFQFYPTFSLPLLESVKLNDLYIRNDVEPSLQLQIGNGGYSVYEYDDGSYTVCWEPFFFVIDKNTLKTVHLPETTIGKPKNHPCQYLAGSSINYFISLDLNKIDCNYVIFYGLTSYEELAVVQNYGFSVVKDAFNDKVLLKTPVRVFENSIRALVFFRIELVEDDWTFIPTRKNFVTVENAEKSMQYLMSRNWQIPDLKDIPDYGFPDEYENDFDDKIIDDKLQ